MDTTRYVGTSDSRLTDEQRRTLDDDGYVVLRDILGEEECNLWSRTIDNAWKKERTSPSPHEYDEEPGVQFVPNLLRHSLLFEKCVIEPRVLEGVRAVLGPDIILHLVNARRADPGHGQQPLHDLNRRRGRPFRTCNTIWCLDKFDSSNGSTRVIPGSHLTAGRFLARMKDPMSPHPDERNVVAPRGAVVIFNSQLIHGGSVNQTDQPRRSVHSYFSLPTVPPKYNWRELPHKIQTGLTPQGRELLGLATSEA